MTCSVPRVSVIVPNYNHARYLEGRLSSIFSQTYQDFEVILLDDASTDESREICLKYSCEPRVRTQLSDVNSGSPFKQWRKGLAMARGSYVWIAESDDCADPRFLESLKSILDSNSNVGLVYAQSLLVDTQGTRLGRYPGYTIFPNRQRWTRDYMNNGRDELINYLAYQNTIPNASGVLFRRALLSEDMLPPRELRLAGDWYLWSSLLLKSDIAFISRPLNSFRIGHPDSQRIRTESEGLEFIEAFEVFRRVDQFLEWPSGQRERILRHRMNRWLILAGKLGYSRAINRRISELFGECLDARPDSPGYLRFWNKALSQALIPLASTKASQATIGRIIENVRQHRRSELMRK